MAPGETAISQSESEAQVDAELNSAASAERERAPVQASHEFARAAKICAQSKRAVTSMFQEARMGKAVDIGGAETVSYTHLDVYKRQAAARS